MSSEFIKSSHSKKVIDVLLGLVVFTLPFSIRITSAVIIFLVLALLIGGGRIIWRNLSYTVISHPLKYSLAWLYLIQIIGLVYSYDLGYGLKSLEIKLALLIFPLLLISYPLSYHKIIGIIKIFVITVLIADVYCWSIVIREMMSSEEQNFLSLFTYYRYHTSYLSGAIGINPIYLSLYTSFAIIVLLWLILGQKKNYWLILIICTLQIFNLLLISRTVLVSQVFICGGLLFYYWVIIEKTFFKVTIAMILFLLSTIIIYSYIPNYKHRFNTLFESGFDKGNMNSANLHVQSWNCAINANNGWAVLIGQGSSDETLALLKCYEKNGYEEMTKEKFNSHNEFLSTYVRHGLIGIGILLIFFSFNFYVAFTNKDILMLSFHLLFFLASMTESTLSVQKGIVFYAFFSSLFLSASPTKSRLSDT